MARFLILQPGGGCEPGDSQAPLMHVDSLDHMPKVLGARAERWANTGANLEEDGADGGRWHPPLKKKK